MYDDHLFFPGRLFGDFLGLYSLYTNMMGEQKSIEKLAEKYQTSVENIIKVYDITSHLNSYLESEVLVSSSDGKFVEDISYVRRGVKNNFMDDNEILGDKSAEAFDRKTWPEGNYDFQTLDLGGFLWHIAYEKGPDYKSTELIVLGYDLIKAKEDKKPFHTGMLYDFAEKKGEVFDNVSEVENFLIDYFSKKDFKKSL